MRGTGSLYLALREYSRYQNLTCLLFQKFKIEESKQFAVHSKKVKSKIDVNLPVASGDKVGSIFRKADRLHLRRDLVARNLQHQRENQRKSESENSLGSKAIIWNILETGSGQVLQRSAMCQLPRTFSKSWSQCCCLELGCPKLGHCHSKVCGLGDLAMTSRKDQDSGELFQDTSFYAISDFLIWQVL